MEREREITLPAINPPCSQGTNDSARTGAPATSRPPRRRPSGALKAPTTPLSPERSRLSLHVYLYILTYTYISF